VPTTIRNGIAAIALALVGWSLTLNPDPTSHVLAQFLLVCAGLLGAVVVGAAIAAEVTFHRTREGLAQLLLRVHELRRRRPSTQDEFAQWKADLETWFSDTKTFLSERLSTAHMAMFITNLAVGDYGLPFAFNTEHANTLNGIRGYVENLQRIADRYLTTRA
jgi:hypothetical protein